MFQRMNWLAFLLTLATPFALASSLEEELIAAATEVAAEVEAESYADLIEGDEVFEGLFTFSHACPYQISFCASVARLIGSQAPLPELGSQSRQHSCHRVSDRRALFRLPAKF